MTDIATNFFIDSRVLIWMKDALCQGESSLFFAPFAERPEARVRREAKAKEICADCEVQVDCKQYARDNRELGFGVVNQKQREPLQDLHQPRR